VVYAIKYSLLTCLLTYLLTFLNTAPMRSYSGRPNSVVHIWVRLVRRCTVFLKDFGTARLPYNNAENLTLHTDCSLDGTSNKVMSNDFAILCVWTKCILIYLSDWCAPWTRHARVSYLQIQFLKVYFLLFETGCVWILLQYFNLKLHIFWPKTAQRSLELHTLCKTAR